MNTLNKNDYKAIADITRCIVCKQRFVSDDIRQNVYKDDRLVGVIHESCYDLYGILV